MTSLNTAVAYYEAMNAKNLPEIKKHLHPDVVFIGPFGEKYGREAVFDAASFFTNFINGVRVLSKFSSGDQAMLVFEYNCPPPVGIVKTAGLITVKDSLVSRIELFFDPRPFEKL